MANLDYCGLLGMGLMRTAVLQRLSAVWRRYEHQAVGLRDNAHHHISRTLVEKYHTLGIDTLNVAGMIRAGLQSKALSDAGMSGLLSLRRGEPSTGPGTQVVVPQLRRHSSASGGQRERRSSA